MRVTSDLFVSALLRRVFSSGGYAAVEKRGNTGAGAIFVISRGRFGERALYGPAAQSSYDEAGPDDRRFSLLIEGEGDGIDERLVKERRFDDDIWVVEIEGGSVPIDDLLSITKP